MSLMTQRVVHQGQVLEIVVRAGRSTAQDVVAEVLGTHGPQSRVPEFALFTEGGVELDAESALPDGETLVLRPRVVR
jgi:hypothetical protein